MTVMQPEMELTAALLTPIGRGAVATVRVIGELEQLDRVAVPLFRAVNGYPLSQQPLRRIAFGQWGRDFVEDIVVSRLSENTLEIHCHGGDAAVRRILDDLEQSGCRIVNWQTQTTDVEGFLQAECLEVLSRATTVRTAGILLEQSSGLLREAFEKLRATGERSASLIDELLSWARFGLHLSQPWSVVLTGRPNVGKSSLINRLLGYNRAIVFDEPGTTRDVVTAETAFDGWPVLLADTAGLRETTEELEAAGIALARARLESADARLVLIDLSQPPTDDDHKLLVEWPDAILIAHKCDLPDRWNSSLPQSALRVSSTTGEGLPELEQRLIATLVPNVPKPGTPIPISLRQVEQLKAAREMLSRFDAAAYHTRIDALIAGELATRSSVD